MFKIKLLFILLLSSLFQITVAWAGARNRIVAYPPDAQYDDRARPAYSFKIDLKENIPYLATLQSKDKDGNSYIELQQLVPNGGSGNYKLQNVGTKIKVNPKSYKVHLALAPNGTNGSIPYIAYVEDDKLKLYRGIDYSSDTNFWTEIPAIINNKSITNVKDLDIAVTKDGSLDIAVMDSQGKVDLLSTQNGLHYIVQNSTFRISNPSSADGEGKSMRLVLSSMSGPEVPYLVFSYYQSYSHWPMAIAEAKYNDWTIHTAPTDSGNLNVEDKFDAVICPTGICTFFTNEANSGSGLQWTTFGSTGNATSGAFPFNHTNSAVAVSPPVVASDGRYEYVAYNAHSTVDFAMIDDTKSFLAYDYSQIFPKPSTYIGLVMYSNGYKSEFSGFVLSREINSPDGFAIKGIGF